MNDSQRKLLFDVLATVPPIDDAVVRREFEEIVAKDIDAIEPLIDEMIAEAAFGAADPPILPLPFHSAVQLLAFLKVHEWTEPRPGYAKCRECHAEFLATLPTGRFHRARCRIAGLITELQTLITKYRKEDAMPFPKTRQALQDNGYSFKESKICPSCNVAIEMWITPKDNVMPLDFRKDEQENEICEPHFATCKDPALYSRRLREKQEKAKQKEAGPIAP